MSTALIGYFAVAVFGLMTVGIVLTAREYRKLNKNDDAKIREKKRNR